MRRISSSASLFLKIFLPTFWLVFFGIFTFAVLISGASNAPIFGGWVFKAGVLGFFIIGALILYFTLMQLKRVEFDLHHLYITSYFKTVRYPLEDMDFIAETNLGVAHLGHIYLKAAGIFGRRITFLQSRQKFEDFIKADPGMASYLKSNNPQGRS
ncbi:MAG: hypothetical protein IPL46_11810 [Saprospiraceae bacterium]|nr:hypothetical protein [Saprospiraceae bacterium]